MHTTYHITRLLDVTSSGTNIKLSFEGDPPHYLSLEAVDDLRYALGALASVIAAKLRPKIEDHD